MAIKYRAIHTKAPWRKVGSHQSLFSAMDGKDGAKALLQQRGRIAEKWEKYGAVLGVMVWDEAQPKGYLLRLKPGREKEVEIVELPIDTILRHEARSECSPGEIAEYFDARSEAHLSQSPPPAQDYSGAEDSAPVGAEIPQQWESSRNEFVRDTAVKEWVRKNAKGICEGCGSAAPFLQEDGTPFLEIHHVHQLVDGGSDRVSNTVALCPNCHRRAHLSKDRQEFRELLYTRIGRLIRE
jgi:hypothetical protein